MKPARASGEAMELIEARRIWDLAPHSAFTDLVRFNGEWFCAFREGAAHVSPDGALRVIASADGARWESAARITSATGDLRDAKLNVAPDGRLMLTGAEALHDRSRRSHQSLAWFSRDGRAWGERVEIGEPNFWLWRVTWRAGKAYGIGYGCGPERGVRLYASGDGARFDRLSASLGAEGTANEASIAFDGDTALCLLRRDGDPGNGLLGAASPPYARWEWKDVGARIGGPHMVRLPDGRLVAAVRLYDGERRTSVCRVDPATGRLEEALRLPSGGDTSYAGLVLDGGILWVSYYSSHEGKTAIYLARVRVGP
jgi:hypothetical protein